jgi:hypothetical protein
VVVNHHRQVPYHLLRCDNSLSCGEPDGGKILTADYTDLFFDVKDKVSFDKKAYSVENRKLSDTD